MSDMLSEESKNKLLKIATRRNHTLDRVLNDAVDELYRRTFEAEEPAPFHEKFNRLYQQATLEYGYVTKTWLAEKLGVSRQSVMHWLSGKHTPSVEQIRKLADLFNVSVEDLL